MEAPTCNISWTFHEMSATFHGRKDVDLIVRSNEIEVDEDDLNEGFCHYSIINDE